ncbi:hypothetical protein V1272_007320 [Bradyrhizobium sp. AZCC 1708]|jgi:hypothetical protein
MDPNFRFAVAQLRFRHGFDDSKRCVHVHCTNYAQFTAIPSARPAVVTRSAIHSRVLQCSDRKSCELRALHGV